MKQHKTKRKRLLVLALCLLTALSMLPVTAMAEADANSGTEGQVTITKRLVSSTPDNDGNYIIKLTVQGNPVTQNVQPNADVVLVVDCSGSMKDTFFTFNSRMAAAQNTMQQLPMICHTAVIQLLRKVQVLKAMNLPRPVSQRQ